jgi:quercetin dioxygenase-like cupin family protein
MNIARSIRAWSALTAITVAGTVLAGPQVRAEAAKASHQGIAVSLVGSYWLSFAPGPKSSLTALRVEIAPDGFTVRQGDRGFLLAYVLAGAVRAQADNGLAVVYEAGESFVEHPWTANSVIENQSRTEPASLLVIFAAAPNTPPPVFDR